MSAFEYIGKNLPRSNAIEKLTGKALFVMDMKFPDILYEKIVRSPYVDARIKRVDASEAL